MTEIWLAEQRGAIVTLLVGLLFLMWGILFIHGKWLPAWLTRNTYTNEDAIISRGENVTYDRSTLIPVHRLVGWILLLVGLCCIAASIMHVVEIESL